MSMSGLIIDAFGLLKVCQKMVQSWISSSEFKQINRIEVAVMVVNQNRYNFTLIIFFGINSYIFLLDICWHLVWYQTWHIYNNFLF